MKEILDEKDNMKNTHQNLTPNKKLRSIAYLFIMVFSGIIYFNFQPVKFTLIAKIYSSLAFILISLIISLVIEGIKFQRRKAKERKSGKMEEHDPFWFKTLEGGFVNWLIIMFFIIFGSIT